MSDFYIRKIGKGANTRYQYRRPGAAGTTAWNNEIDRVEGTDTFWIKGVKLDVAIVGRDPNDENLALARPTRVESAKRPGQMLDASKATGKAIINDLFTFVDANGLEWRNGMVRGVNQSTWKATSSAAGRALVTARQAAASLRREATLAVARARDAERVANLNPDARVRAAPLRRNEEFVLDDEIDLHAFVQYIYLAGEEVAPEVLYERLTDVVERFLTGREENQRNLIVRFIDRYANFTYKSIPMPDEPVRPGRNVRREAYNFIVEAMYRLLRGETNSHGSDDISDGSWALDTSYYAYNIAKVPAGGCVHGKKTSYKTSDLWLYGYPSDRGNCLISAVKNQTPGAPRKHLASVRKEMCEALANVPADGDIPCTVEVITWLANYYGTSIVVYGDTPDVKQTFVDNEHGNSCVTTQTLPVIAEARIEGADCVSIVLTGTDEARHRCNNGSVLLPNHYYGLREHFHKKYCPVTGELLVTGRKLTKDAIKEILRRQGRVLVSGKPKQYVDKVLVFDFETTWEPKTGELHAYAVGWTVFDMTADYDFTDACTMSYVRSEGDARDVCETKLLKYIQSVALDVRLLLVGWNSSNFDNYLLARCAAQREKLTGVQMTGSTLRNVKIGRHSSLDLCKLCPSSLNDACISYKAKPAKQPEIFDHVFVQNQHIAGRLQPWLDSNRELLLEYLNADVKSTASLFVILRNTLKDLVGVDFAQRTRTQGVIGTIGSLSWKGFEAAIARAGKQMPPPLETEELDKFFRSSIVGGRTQNFREVGYSDRCGLRMVDVTSLYPTVMCGAHPEVFGHLPNNVHYGLFPVTEPIPTDAYVPGKIGFYNVRVISQPEVAVLPKRAEKRGDPLDWTPKGEFTTVTTSVEIELIRHYGGEIEVGSGYYFDGGEKLFSEYIDPIIGIKSREDGLKEAKSPDYNPALRSASKLLMNSLSGKFAQRNFEEKTILAKGHVNAYNKEKTLRGGRAEWFQIGGNMYLLRGKKPADKVYDKKTAKPSYIASLIYAYARAYMYVTALQYNTMYMDTDSALMKTEDYTRFREAFPQLDPVKDNRLKELGDYEEELFKGEGEHDDCYCVLIRPKCYYVATGTTEAKIRCKGIRLCKDGCARATCACKKCGCSEPVCMKCKAARGSCKCQKKSFTNSVCHCATDGCNMTKTVCRCDRMIESELAERLVAAELTEKHEIRTSELDFYGKPVDRGVINLCYASGEPWKLFEGLAEGSVHVLCSQLKRDAKTLQLVQKYTIKTLTGRATAQ